MAAVQTSGEKTLNRVAIVSVLVITLIFLAPIYWIVSTSFKPTTRYIRNIGIATTTGGSMRVDNMKKRRSASPFTRKREKP